MNLWARLQCWWDKLLGRPPWYRDTNVTISRSDLWSDEPRRKKPKPGELTLSEDPNPKGPRSRRSAGVDPYANDAGFAKPQGWDKLDHD